MSEALRILVVDDHPVFRLGLRNLFEGLADFEVVAEASSGGAAIELAGSLRPDVILMDIGLPDINGIEATRQICAANAGARILVLTMFDDESVFDAVQAGALGYVLKGADPDETIRAVR